MAKPTPEQIAAARKAETAKTLLHLAKQGNKKAREEVAKKGGKDGRNR